MKRLLLSLVVLTFSVTLQAETRRVSMLSDENWWGLANYYGSQMPFTSATELTLDLRKDGHSNQYASLLVSDKGRVLWCDDQVGCRISGGTIELVSDRGPILLEQGGATLAEAFRFASAQHFPPSGKTPDLLFFSAPQYNTWIELTYHQNERDILAYAQSMLDHGLPPGVFMIDDTWQADYGDWRFEPSRFADPKGMCEKLNAMGFKVVLWMCPYVSMDSPAFRRLAWGRNPDDVKGYPTKGGFLMTPDGKRPQGVDWWNGVSAHLDLTHPNAQAWFDEQLERLVRDYGVAGFKFDGGHLPPYAQGYRTHDPNATSGDQVLAYARYALKYPVCEYRNAWRFQGEPVVERLHDKNHSWAALRKLVPDLIAGGLLGHPFMCPDMIGGGEWTAFLPGAPFEPELFVRSAQVHALCGMMQFSASPWRVLPEEHQQIVRDLVKLRQEKFADTFVELAKTCGRTGEPMIRNLEYAYPHQGYAAVTDEFMMGDDLLVAPVLEQGAVSRTVVLPPGTWLADDGTRYVGPCTITVSAPLTRLPYFTRETLEARVTATWRQMMAEKWSPKTGLIYNTRPENVKPAREFVEGLFRWKKGEPDGYGRGMSDCSIISGIGLAALCDAYAVTGDEALRAEARRVAQGLFSNATAHGYRGFVARGICEEDGRSICALSSIDQHTHWFHGLWHYARSPLASEADRARIAALFVEVLERIERMATPANDYDFCQADGEPDPRGICHVWHDLPPKEWKSVHASTRLPMFYLATWDLTGDEKWKAGYEKYADVALAVNQRLCDEDPDQWKWIMPTYSLLQMACANEVLYALEQDPVRKARYADCLRAGAKVADGRAKDMLAHPGKKWYGMCPDAELALSMLYSPDFDFDAVERAILTDRLKKLTARDSLAVTHYVAAYWRARRRGLVGVAKVDESLLQ